MTNKKKLITRHVNISQLMMRQEKEAILLDKNEIKNTCIRQKYQSSPYSRKL